jgi:monofunctional biosynthetic peptidoglycan transglycosylase
MAKAQRKPKSVKAAPRGRPGLMRRLLMLLFIAGVVLPVGAVVAYRFIPPPITSLMVLRFFEGRGMDYRWRSIDDISPTLAQAAIASEDSRFCLHHGFELAAIEKALEHNEKSPNKLRGGSTISQQTSKNAFLWPGRDYVRKGLEAYFTVLTEAIWGKRRIMEVYLNIVEWGSGVYGAEAASEVYFGHSAKHLTTSEAAHLVAILPSPLKWKAVNSGRYVQRRAGTVAERVGTVRSDGLSGCLAR